MAAAADGLSATVTPGLPGAATVSVTSTDLDGTKLVGAAQVTVTFGEAVAAEISFAAPAPAPPAEVAPAEAAPAVDAAPPDAAAPAAEPEPTV